MRSVELLAAAAATDRLLPRTQLQSAIQPDPAEPLLGPSRGDASGRAGRQELWGAAAVTIQQCRQRPQLEEVRSFVLPNVNFAATDYV